MRTVIQQVYADHRAILIKQGIDIQLSAELIDIGMPGITPSQ